MSTDEPWATVVWQGDWPRGSGVFQSESGALDGVPTKLARRPAGRGQTNPEELLAAALADCYAMSLAYLLRQEGHPPVELVVKATCGLEFSIGSGYSISSLTLSCQATVDGIDVDTLERLAVEAKGRCVISKTLQDSVAVNLEAKLV